MTGVGQKLRVGVALGGGTARASAHVGVLRVLEANRLAPSEIAGTSAGAMLASLYALGRSVDELERIVTRQPLLELWRQTLSTGLHRGGLINPLRFERWLDEIFFHGAIFADTLTPLTIACTDLETGKLVLQREGRIARAVAASSAFPLLVAPVEIAGRYLVDGGLTATIPFAALGADLDLRIGVHAGVNTEGSFVVNSIRRYNRSSFGRWWQRCLLTAPAIRPLRHVNKGFAHILSSYEQRVLAPDGCVLIDTDPRITWWDFHRAKQAVAIGESSARSAVATLAAKVERLP